PRAAMGWIGLVWTMPLLGAAIYGLFGINRVRTRARRISDEADQPSGPRTPPDPVPPTALDSRANLLARISDAVSDRPIVGGNQVQVLHNGDEAFPAMLDEIAAAQRSVYLMTYIMNRDEVGRAFVDALAQARNRGVAVKVLIDGMGEYDSWRRIGPVLRRAGVPFARFLPPRLLPPSIHLNLRNHRKVLVIDDQVAFAGGMNISARHELSSASPAAATADVHFKFQGPVAGQLQDVFASSWRFATREALASDHDACAAPGTSACRAINDGPDEDLDKLAQILRGAVSAAKSSVQILTPYFLPSSALIGALQAAALRGVEVQIVLPERSNKRVVDWATQRILGELIARGVHIYKQPAPFHHGKLFVVDRSYLLLGSANLDPRSLRLNFEVGVEVFDEAAALEVWSYVEQIRLRSQTVKIEELTSRSLPRKLRDAFCWLFSPYL
ncbi:MAG: phospholipase D-like domain-containing protein, partial [Pseudomonadota bacterium]